MIESLPLAKSKREWIYILLFFVIIFTSNVLYLYSKFKLLKEDELLNLNAKVLNIYPKNKYVVLKLQNKNLTFFTSSNNKNIKQNDTINLNILTSNITFISYLKGFYAKSFSLYKLDINNNISSSVSEFISNQHSLKITKEIFNALFLAIPISKDLKIKIASFGISHLLAISGFHLGILSSILYFILFLIYHNIHKKYFPYRNKKYDILLFISFLLLFYIYIIDDAPSLLRSLVMYIFAIFLLRSNIKLISFSTLLLISLFIISIFPKLLFSLGLFFSVSGVFYIFLYIKYFKNLNKYFSFLLFNFWIFFAINPIIHYFFSLTSLEQLYSPIISIIFIIFYPIELFLHIINYGFLFDNTIDIFLNTNIYTKDIYTSNSFFIGYIIFSLLSIRYKFSFILLHILFIYFNYYLYFIPNYAIEIVN